jgi:cytochrome oxidase assembly protein ShyY1
MRRLAFLLRPGWVALAVVVIAFTYLCFSVLAPWQLGKNTKTSRENDQIQQSLTTEPVPLKTLLPQQDSSAPNAQWRRVTATGHYLPDKQLVARLRVADGDPAMAAPPFWSTAATCGPNQAHGYRRSPSRPAGR